MDEKTATANKAWNEHRDRRLLLMLLLPIVCQFPSVVLNAMAGRWISALADALVIACWLYWRRTLASLLRTVRERLFRAEMAESKSHAVHFELSRWARDGRPS